MCGWSSFAIPIPVSSTERRCALPCVCRRIETLPPSGEVAILATSGTVMCKIIQQELGKKHIQTLLPDERQQQKIMEIIYKQIKAGRSVEIEEFEQIGTQLQQRGAQKLLLGCTELSLLKRDFTLNQAYADVLEILASAVVTYNGLPVKEYHRQTQEIK